MTLSMLFKIMFVTKAFVTLWLWAHVSSCIAMTWQVLIQLAFKRKCFSADPTLKLAIKMDI